MVRSVVTAVLEIVGGVVTVLGVALVYRPAAVILTGLLLIGLSYVLTRDPEGGADDVPDLPR